MIRRPPRSTQSRSSAASDVYKRQVHGEFKKMKKRNIDPERVIVAVGPKNSGKTQILLRLSAGSAMFLRTDWNDTQEVKYVRTCDLDQLKEYQEEALFSELRQHIGLIRTPEILSIGLFMIKLPGEGGRLDLKPLEIYERMMRLRMFSTWFIVFNQPVEFKGRKLISKCNGYKETMSFFEQLHPHDYQIVDFDFYHVRSSCRSILEVLEFEPELIKTCPLFKDYIELQDYVEEKEKEAKMQMQEGTRSLQTLEYRWIMGLESKYDKNQRASSMLSFSTK
eukprot:TRINITY_DN6380_c0_g1_i2.p1 TRINITY_DN6380_c0_g1~~TRINITY_DN6380_c0_g1_i2.p1  ORF type:complete len:279 (-),score=26.31 TRINITY_DN6380_c0_g1_i2:142-978(-)